MSDINGAQDAALGLPTVVAPGLAVPPPQATQGQASGAILKHFGWLIPLLLGVLAGIGSWAEGSGPPRVIFAAIVLVLVGFCIVVGKLLCNRLDGILVDDRCRLSLSRFQWLVWFVVIFSGFVTGALLRAKAGQPPLEMDDYMYGLLGIVTASPVISGIILDTKKGDGSATATSIGSLDRNQTVADAAWIDLVLGEEVANASVVDVSRMQKLIVTIILGVVYTGALWNIFGDWAAPGPERMPPVAESFLVLLGVSHAGYLASKATPKTAPTG
jgi:hypothetical protein